MEVTDRYRYLGLVLTEHLDYNITAKSVAQAAHRALGILIAKGRVHGGFPYSIYTKLYNTLVQPIIDYGSHVWGHKTFAAIQAMQIHALRYFLGLGKRAPLAALQGDMGWTHQEHHQWLTVTRQWYRLVKMVPSWLSHRVFIWAHDKARLGKRISYFHVIAFYRQLQMDHVTNVTNGFDFNNIRDDLDMVLKEHFQALWYCNIIKKVQCMVQVEIN